MGKGSEDPRGGSGRGKVWEGWWGRKNWARGSGRWGGAGRRGMTGELPNRSEV